ncbi:signal transduction histidine kinase [Thermosporothrix hazakensis]|jgi:signal transduction histidine kinase|uniref:histidine kinase n=2 Tax=Thermosporothrix TaxID=768650 RepID=A0A326U4K6_THEHA|nr:HAMP domain-containing sensor histidine kinase [Thermosporothrix hazakensis]PZW26667.1 signal transduction histidine kinase [Thermosporothrix hazakensis]BBH89449.1 hypothetical protein KTC_42000 [Thermosporothrix sp. COM3]GCE47632.1 hypothetical protein KTH_25010 [Thermosporothrix hazakensis]
MQVQHEPTQVQQETIEALQKQIEELTASNLLLQEEIERKEQFIAMIAHELRNPLAPIINYAQMLHRHLANVEDQEPATTARRPRGMQRNASIIVSQAQRMARLVNDLLDANKLASNQFSILPRPCDLVTIVKESVEQLRPVAPYHTFVVETPDTSVPGNWDEGRLHQALGNLLDNAIKYSDEGSTITVKVWLTSATAEQPALVHVSVHNQGITIPPEERGHLFQPFVRLEATRERRKGNGLGLYITHSIIEAHGGTLRLELPEPGQSGTTFCFDLPLQDG